MRLWVFLALTWSGLGVALFVMLVLMHPYAGLIGYIAYLFALCYTAYHHKERR